jgi:hypothetical protein
MYIVDSRWNNKIIIKSHIQMRELKFEPRSWSSV